MHQTSGRLKEHVYLNHYHVLIPNYGLDVFVKAHDHEPLKGDEKYIS